MSEITETFVAKSSFSNGSKMINQYRIKSGELGVGAQAKVVECIDSFENKKFAMKIIKRTKIRQSSGDTNDKIAELQVMKRLTHPYIVQLHEIINDPTRSKVYLVMDLLSGGSLQKKLEESENGLSKEFIWQVARNVVSALYYCHSEVRVFHRDIKPENIMLNDQNKAVLVDFGVAALFENDDVIKGTAGSMRYFSPEIVKTGAKKVFGTKTDVWALGVTLYQLATNKYPFEANSIPGLQK